MEITAKANSVYYTWNLGTLLPLPSLNLWFKSSASFFYWVLSLVRPIKWFRGYFYWFYSFDMSNIRGPLWPQCVWNVFVWFLLFCCKNTCHYPRSSRCISFLTFVLQFNLVLVVLSFCFQKRRVLHAWVSLFFSPNPCFLKSCYKGF